MANENKKREGLNRTTIIGSVVGKPEKRVPLALRLEVTEREKIGDNWQDVTAVFAVLVSGNRAESLNKLELEGSRLYVEGPLRNGKTSGYVLAHKVVLLGGKRRDQVDTAPAGSDDEIPF